MMLLFEFGGDRQLFFNEREWLEWVSIRLHYKNDNQLCKSKQSFRARRRNISNSKYVKKRKHYDRQRTSV